MAPLPPPPIPERLLWEKPAHLRQAFSACTANPTGPVWLCPLQAAMLIPVGIILYTVAGGLKATFISSYVHTVIIYVVRAACPCQAPDQLPSCNHAPPH